MSRFRLTDAALGLFAYAAFGNPEDSLVALEQRVERLIPSYVKRRGDCARARRCSTSRPCSLFRNGASALCTEPRLVGTTCWSCNGSLARGDTRECGRSSGRCDRLRRGLRPGDVAFDGTYHEARLLLALGDTARSHTAAGSDAQCASDAGSGPAGSGSPGGDSWSGEWRCGRSWRPQPAIRQPRNTGPRMCRSCGRRRSGAGTSPRGCTPYCGYPVRSRDSRGDSYAEELVGPSRTKRAKLEACAYRGTSCRLPGLTCCMWAAG